MKIVEETHTKLTIRKGAIGFFSITGSISVLVGVAVTISGHWNSFSCNRIYPSVANCQLVESSLLETQEKTITLNKFQGAKVETMSSGDDSTYRVVILNNNGEEPLTSYWNSNFDEKQKIVSRINSFVGNTGQKYLMVEQDERWDVLKSAGFATVFGFSFIMAEASIITCTFDKNLGSFTMKREGLFGTKVIQHQIKEIKDVELESDGDDSSRISFILVSGDRIPFTFLYSNYGNKEEIIRCIRKFLNL